MLKDEPNRPSNAGARAGDRNDDTARSALMGMLGWVMMGLAIWHFTIFLPDRFWGGIVGAFVGSLVGAVVIGADHLQRQSLGPEDPRREGDRHRRRALRGPGALIGIAAVYLEGMRRERANRRPPRSPRAAISSRAAAARAVSVAAPPS